MAVAVQVPGCVVVVACVVVVDLQAVAVVVPQEAIRAVSRRAPKEEKGGEYRQGGNQKGLGHCSLLARVGYGTVRQRA